MDELWKVCSAVILLVPTHGDGSKNELSGQRENTTNY